MVRTIMTPVMAFNESDNGFVGTYATTDSIIGRKLSLKLIAYIEL